MTMPQFATYAEAYAAGYVPPRQFEVYRGYRIRSRDVSGGRSFGYAYAIEVCLDSSWDDPRAPHRFGLFGRSSTVFLSAERNAIGQPGAQVQMFSPESLQQGLAAARAAIDAYYDCNPAAAEIERAYQAWRAETDARQAARAAERAARRAARLAAE